MSLYLWCRSISYLGIRGSWARDGGFKVITVEAVCGVHRQNL